jgi:hypothetical protein
MRSLADQNARHLPPMAQDQLWYGYVHSTDDDPSVPERRHRPDGRDELSR